MGGRQRAVVGEGKALDRTLELLCGIGSIAAQQSHFAAKVLMPPGAVVAALFTKSSDLVQLGLRREGGGRVLESVALERDEQPIEKHIPRAVSQRIERCCIASER